MQVEIIHFLFVPSSVYSRFVCCSMFWICTNFCHKSSAQDDLKTETNWFESVINKDQDNREMQIQKEAFVKYVCSIRIDVFSPVILSSNTNFCLTTGTLQIDLHNIILCACLPSSQPSYTSRPSKSRWSNYLTMQSDLYKSSSSVYNISIPNVIISLQYIFLSTLFS